MEDLTYQGRVVWYGSQWKFTLLFVSWMAVKPSDYNPTVSTTSPHINYWYHRQSDMTGP